MLINIRIFIVDRANYGRLLPLIKLLSSDERFEVETVFTGSTLLTEVGLLKMASLKTE